MESRQNCSPPNKNDNPSGCHFCLAEGVGFEPTAPLRAQRFSRPSSSTAPAPFRKVLGITGANKSDDYRLYVKESKLNIIVSDCRVCIEQTLKTAPPNPPFRLRASLFLVSAGAIYVILIGISFILTLSMKVFIVVCRWLCAGLITLAVGVWIFACTLNVTILNRDTITGWLTQSGVFEKGLESIVRVSPSQGNDVTSVINNGTFGKALVKTFPPSYVKAQSRIVIDATYDWLEGKTVAIHFSIPVQNKAEEFRKNLARAVEPSLASLPKCGNNNPNTSTKVTCLPPNTSPSDYADRIVKLPEDTDFLKKPITEKTFGITTGSGLIQILPVLVLTISVLTWALPLTTLLLGFGYVMLYEDRIRGLRRLGRKVALSAVVGLVGGLLLWLMSHYVSVDWLLDASDANQAAQFKAYVLPLVQRIMTGVGLSMIIFAGAAVVIGFALWLAMLILMRRRRQSPVAPAVDNIDPQQLLVDSDNIDGHLLAEDEGKKLPPPQL
jgi:hypothetical protein